MLRKIIPLSLGCGQGGEEGEIPLTSYPEGKAEMADGGENSFQQQTRERLNSLKTFTTTNFSRAKQVVCFINLMCLPAHDLP